MTDKSATAGGQQHPSPSADELAESVRTLVLEPEPASAGVARRFVISALNDWAATEFCDDAAVCTAELATNAILHSRDRFTVAVRRSAPGIRIDVLDNRPDRLPLTVPDSLGPLDTGTTGRGLLMVAALANRWGYFTTGVAKTVWVELSEPVSPGDPTTPVIELADRVEIIGNLEVTLIDVPVQVAIASGIQVDELVRVVQLYQHELSSADRDAFLNLVERSARPRLIGRQEAFQAAGEGRASYQLHLAASAEEFAAVAELSPLLQRLAVDVRVFAGAVSNDVLAMRTWISSEIAAQGAGAAPTAYQAH